jgi:hypothetical protein
VRMMAAVIGLFHSHCVSPVLAGRRYRSNPRAIFGADVNERLAFDFVARSILAEDKLFGFPDDLPYYRSENRTPVPVGDVVRYDSLGSGAFTKLQGANRPYLRILSCRVVLATWGRRPSRAEKGRRHDDEALAG